MLAINFRLTQSGDRRCAFFVSFSYCFCFRFVVPTAVLSYCVRSRSCIRWSWTKCLFYRKILCIYVRCTQFALSFSLELARHPQNDVRATNQNMIHKYYICLVCVSVHICVAFAVHKNRCFSARWLSPHRKYFVVRKVTNYLLLINAFASVSTINH